MTPQPAEVESYVVVPGRWKLSWICTFCLAQHLWERRIPNDDEVRKARFAVAAALNSHLHCAPGCGRWISLGAVDWRWEPDDE